MSSQLEKVNSSLPLDESLHLQNKARVIQQIGIIFIFLLILLAALGFFGEGVLSSKKLAAHGSTVMYEKFGRHGGESKLEFKLAADTITQISIPAAYFEFFKIETIIPQPDKNNATGDRFVYMFNGGDTKKITFFLSPEKIGSIEALITANKTDFKLSHFIYP